MDPCFRRDERAEWARGRPQDHGAQPRAVDGEITRSTRRAGECSIRVWAPGARKHNTARSCESRNPATETQAMPGHRVARLSRVPQAAGVTEPGFRRDERRWSASCEASLWFHQAIGRDGSLLSQGRAGRYGWPAARYPAAEANSRSASLTVAWSCSPLPRRRPGPRAWRQRDTVGNRLHRPDFHRSRKSWIHAEARPQRSSLPDLIDLIRQSMPTARGQRTLPDALSRGHP